MERWVALNQREPQSHLDTFLATAQLVRRKVPDKQWVLKMSATFNSSNPIFVTDYMPATTKANVIRTNYLISNQDGLYNRLSMLSGKAARGRVTVGIDKAKQQ